MLICSPERTVRSSPQPQLIPGALYGLADRLPREQRAVELLREDLGAHVIHLPGRADVVPDAELEELVR